IDPGDDEARRLQGNSGCEHRCSIGWPYTIPIEIAQDPDAFERHETHPAAKRIEDLMGEEECLGPARLECKDRLAANGEERSLLRREHHLRVRSEEHTSELQSRFELVCRL